jgi:hypothetical protein
MRRIMVVALALALAFSGPIQPGRAQSGEPGAIGDGSLTGTLPETLPSYLVIGPDGQVHFNPDGLTPGEPIVLDAPPGFWQMDGPLPGTDLQACLGCLVYNTYTTATGETVVVPNAYTAVVMAVTGYSPFDTPAELAIGNGALQLAAMAGAFEGLGIPPEEFTLENLLARFDPNSNQFDPLFMLQLNIALNDPDNPLNSGAFFWAAGLFQFACHPVTGECAPVLDQAPTPPGAPGDDPREQVCQILGDCQPLTGICPARDFAISAPPPDYVAEKLLPPFPVVVGQDPAGRGVDVRAGVTVPPVTVAFNVERVYPGERVCQWVGNGQGGGCTPGSYDSVAFPDGFQPWMATDPDWGSRDTTRRVCERVTRTYPDPVASFNVRLQLDAGSIAWIETGDLQQRYPGARVYQALWPLWPGRPPARQAVSLDGAQLALEWARVPLRDPGQYHIVLAGVTAGTPYTAPRPLAFGEVVFDVALFEAALIK